MDIFNALWDNPEQRKRPPDNSFQAFTLEEWFAISSTHKILSGSFKCPLPREIKLPEIPKAQDTESINKTKKVKLPMPSQGACSSFAQNHQPSIQSSMDKPYVPGLVKFPICSRVSCLSREEQQDCLMLLQKFDGKNLGDISIAERTEFQLFQSLYIRVKNEQKEFLDCAKQCWPEYINRTSRLKGDPHNFILQLWKDRVSRAMGLYLKSYRRVKTIPLKKMRGVELLLTRHLLNIGKVPLIKLPQFDKPFRIASSIIKLRNWTLFNIPPAQLAGLLHKIPVSKDPNAERLARLHEADVVISSSGFKCLLSIYDSKKHPDPSGVGKPWVLPVIVKEHRSFDNGKPVRKTVVFIDKKLPPSKMTGYQRVSWYHKCALSAALVQSYHTGGIEFDIKGAKFITSRDCTKNTLGSASSAAVTKEPPKETMTAVSSDSSTLKLKEITASVREQSSMSRDEGSSNPFSSTVFLSPSQSDSEDSCDESLTIALSDEESTKVTKDEVGSYASKTNEDCVSSTMHQETETKMPVENLKTTHPASLQNKTLHNTLENCLTVPQLQATQKFAAMNVSNSKQETLESPNLQLVNGLALPPDITNVTYNLWSLRAQLPEKYDDLKRSTKSNINLLIRSHIDGCESLGSDTYQQLSLTTKAEFQLEFGAGAISLRDLTCQWAKLMIQPETQLARVRVNAISSEMVKVEKRTKAEVEREAQALYNEDLTSNLANLHEVLSDLMQVPCGEYILSHRPEMGLATELMVKTPDGEVEDMNLSTDYQVSPVPEQCDVPWQPLDATVVMPKNVFFKQMPCTFQAFKGPTTLPKRNQQITREAVTVNTFNKKKKPKKNKQKKESFGKAVSHAE